MIIHLFKARNIDLFVRTFQRWRSDVIAIWRRRRFCSRKLLWLWDYNCEAGESVRVGTSLEEEAMWVQLWIQKGSEIQARKARQLVPSTTETEKRRVDTLIPAGGRQGQHGLLCQENFFFLFCRHDNEIAVYGVFTLFCIDLEPLLPLLYITVEFFVQSYFS